MPGLRVVRAWLAVMLHPASPLMGLAYDLPPSWGHGQSVPVAPDLPPAQFANVAPNF